jgi:hypothetical protein
MTDTVSANERVHPAFAGERVGARGFGASGFKPKFGTTKKADPWRAGQNETG